MSHDFFQLSLSARTYASSMLSRAASQEFLTFLTVLAAGTCDLLRALITERLHRMGPSLFAAEVTSKAYVDIFHF